MFARQAGAEPGGVIRPDLGILDLGPDAAFPAAQIIPEPGHHQGGRLQVRQFLAKRLGRHREIRLLGGGGDIGAAKAARRCLEAHRRRRQRIFPRAGDQRDPFDAKARHMFPPRHAGLFGTQHLEGELRHPVAIGCERNVLHHHIGRASIGRHPAHAFDGLDHRIGQLVIGAIVDPHVQVIRRHFLAIGPDPAHPRDLPLADRDGKAHRIAELGHLGLAAAALAATGGR